MPPLARPSHCRLNCDWSANSTSVDVKLLGDTQCSCAVFAPKTGAQWQVALSLLSFLRLLSMRTVVSFSAAMSACGNGKQWIEALKLQLELETVGLQCNVISQNAALSACEKGDEWLRASHLLCHGFSQLQRSLVSVNSVISACEKGTVWRNALALHRGAQERHTELDCISFIAALGACEKASEWHHALWLLDVLGGNVEIGTCNCAISACKKSRQWQQAVEVRSSIIPRRRLHPDVITLSSLVVAADGRAVRTVRQSLQELRGFVVKLQQ